MHGFVGAQVAQVEQMGCVGALEGHVQDVVNELQRLKSIFAKKAQYAQNN